jgi:ribosomal protein S18 acetylase RimI-like enzyme
VSSPEYTIRRATVADVPAALAMKLAAWRETYSGQRPESFFAAEEARREQQTDWWSRGLAAGAELWIAEDAAGRIVGCSGGAPVIEDDADAGVPNELQLLYVLAEAHGTGLGLRLMDAAIGSTPALLWVLEHNPRAQAFYRRHGFVPDGRREPMVGAWEGLHEIRMVRRG